jgi:inner membrane protein
VPVPSPDTFPAVENITHSLLGATLAEVALPPGASAEQRRLFFAAGIIAANLPDADLFYTRITAPPVGYLLHHRGHTHTLVGCGLLALGIWVVTRLPAIRRIVEQSPARFWALIGFALLSHIVADSWNSYGVHPFWPIGNQWYYGDAVYILEPWLWLILGLAVAANTRNRGGRLVLYGALIALPVALAWIRMIAVGALVALAVGGAGLVWFHWRREPRERSTAALVLVAGFVVGMVMLNGVVRDAALTARRGNMNGVMVDLVLNPRPASPLCWTTMSIEKDERAGEYSLRRGNVALFAGALTSLCAEPNASSIAGWSRSAVSWSEPVRQSLPRLRELDRGDCWVRAWLQFGRAPIFSDAGIADFRFGGVGYDNFSFMPFRPPAEATVCPKHLTRWDSPRADLLSRNSED